MPPPHLLSAGEAFEDLVFVGLDHLPASGEEVRTNRFSRTIGGGAVTTAVAASRLGLAVTLASALSDDAVRRLRTEQLRVVNLRQAGEPHAISAALSTTTERAFVTFDGVNVRLEARLARLLSTTPATHVHLALYPRDCAAWAKRVRRLHRRGITTSWDFGWNDALAQDSGLPELLDALSIVFVNEREATLYAHASDWSVAEAFWRDRRSLTIVKRGAKGCAAVTPNGLLSVPAPRVTPVDTTGAGDAFNGGFLHSWLGGKPLGACLRAGNRLGAASTRKAGGLDALPRRKPRR